MHASLAMCGFPQESLPEHEKVRQAIHVIYTRTFSQGAKLTSIKQKGTDPRAVLSVLGSSSDIGDCSALYSVGEESVTIIPA